MHRELSAILVAVALAAVLLCAGCGGKFTRQRYETIYVSMPDWKVREVLGEPTARSPRQWVYVHRGPYYRATIRFDEGKAVDKSWSVEKPR